jgi:hypothetical protein
MKNILTNYMKDHFAGSVAAVELLNHLTSSHREKTHEQFFIQLREEIGEDQEVSAEIVARSRCCRRGGAPHDSFLEREVSANKAAS